MPSADARMVITTTSGGLQILDATGAELARAGGAEQTYRQPVFAPDGSVLVSETGATDSQALVRLSPDLAEITRTERDSPPFYYHPKPDGPFRSTSLRNDPSGGGLVIEEIVADGTMNVLARTAPYYTSWEPGGDRIATHVETARLEVRSPDGTVDVVVEGTGVYQAPVWTDSGVLTLRTIGGRQHLSRWSDAGIEDLATVDGPVQFVAAGRSIAVQSLSEPAGGVQTALRSQDLPSIPVGRLVVLDADTGTQATVTSDVALYFEWDRTGERLLYATIEEASSATIRWQVWAGGSSTDFGTFEASPLWVRDTVPFFDQYVQSAPLWNPDGSSFAYPAIESGEAVVVVQALDGASFLVPDATWVTWSR